VLLFAAELAAPLGKNQFDKNQGFEGQTQRGIAGRELLSPASVRELKAATDRVALAEANNDTSIKNSDTSIKGSV
jgi:hypothetical protein